MCDQIDGFPTGLAGCAQQYLAAGALGKVGRLNHDGDAALGAIGTTGQVGDGKTGSRSCENRARRGHAIKQAKNLELGFELVRDAINCEIGLANGILNAGDENDLGTVAGQRLRAKLLAEELLRVMQVVRHHVFKEDTKSTPGRMKCKPAAKGASSDNSDGLGQIRDYLTARAMATSSAFGFAWRRCSATRARSSAERVGTVASTRRRVTATSSM